MVLGSALRTTGLKFHLGLGRSDCGVDLVVDTFGGLAVHCTALRCRVKRKRQMPEVS